jgi:hypothetical protein
MSIPPTYRQVVWAQVKSQIFRSETPTHLFWAIVPPVIAGALAVFIARRESQSVLIETASGIAGVILALSGYIAYLRLQAPRKIWEASLPRAQETHGASIGQNPTFIPNITNVIPLVLPLIATNEHSASQLTIKVFGLDLETVTPWLQQLATDHIVRANIAIKVLMIDVGSEVIKQIVGGPKSNVSIKTAEASREKIAELADNAAFTGRGISIELRSYAAAPFFHGYLVGDKYLFLGFTEIRYGKLQGSNYPYMHLTFDGGSAHVKHYFRVFDQWFDFYWQRGPSLVRSA